MAISTYDEERIEGAFLDAFAMEKHLDMAKGLLLAWNQLWELMAREDNFSDTLGSEVLDWQIGNWAGDVIMELHNAGLRKECIAVNEQIMKIDFGQETQNFHENAYRDMADEYAYVGEINYCLSLYEKRLKEDSLWGWGWIGYFRIVHDEVPDSEERFLRILNDLYQRINAGEVFRDAEDLYRELGDEYNALGMQEKADACYALEDKEREKRHVDSFSSVALKRPFSASQVSKKKIYPNDLCPCGSGKKYKKCCGKK